jgi:hypothetical protein
MRTYCVRLWIAVLLLTALIGEMNANASGPHRVAGVNYFDPAAKGKPVVWANGQVSYYLDQGALSSSVSNSQAAAAIASAAAVWSSVPTAAVNITQGGSLNEDVSGSNVTANSPAGTGATLPADAQPSATGQPVAIVLDADGSVIDDMYGPSPSGLSASDPNNCTQTGVYTSVDNFSTAGNIVHALIVVNGRCATSSALDGLLEYEMIRAFGRVLGLDWSQVNEAMWPNKSTTDGLAGWPLMHPTERLCSGSTTTCMPNQFTLRLDDIAGLNQLYPVTTASGGKTVTAPATITVQGKVTFRNGQGMQGVNVVLTPVNGNTPDLRYPVSTVSGAYFRTNAGNPVTGPTDTQGNAYGRFGTDDAAQEGSFVLSGVPLPPGATSATYQLSIEPVNALYTGNASVGPYSAAQVTPSGAMQTVLLGDLSAGSTATHDFVMTDSADSTQTDDGMESAPNNADGNGEWIAKLVGYGHTGWFQFHARANRYFRVEASSLDETGLGSTSKAAVMIGLWNGTDPVGALPVYATAKPFNGNLILPGMATVSGQTEAGGEIRMGFADARGDGRQDFTYHARVLYADSVSPARLPLKGGTISIFGQGFRPGITVHLNGVQASVTSVTPTEITALAPPVRAATGTVVLAVQDPQTLGLAEILDGLSYDAQGTDGVRIVPGSPSGTVYQGVPISQGVPMSVTVQVVAGDGTTPAENLLVSFAVASGAAQLGCGTTPCTAMTNGNGLATMSVTATGAQTIRVSATLSNGTSIVAAEFAAGAPPQIAATNTLYIAIGAQVSWTPTAVVLSSGNPVNGAAVQWSVGTGTGAQVAAVAAHSTSNAAGLASTTVIAGPLAAGTTANVYACQSGSSTCATFTINAVHAVEQARLLPVSGAGQSLAASDTVMPVTLEVVVAGHPVAGATVNFYQQMTAWQPPCPARGRCPASQQLGSQASTVTSDANGLVTLTPMSSGGNAVMLNVLATTGQSGTLSFSIAEQP